MSHLNRSILLLFLGVLAPFRYAAAQAPPCPPFDTTAAWARVNRAWSDETGLRWSNDSLRRVLLALRDRDQGARTEFGARATDTLYGRQLMRLDSALTAELVVILDRFGLPTRSMVGSAGTDAAMLVVQHSASLQERVLALAKAAPPGQISVEKLAMLEDRVLVHQGKPQRFGTQFTMGPDGIFRFAPVSEAANLDARRSAAGMPPLRQYVCLFEEAGMRVDRGSLPPGADTSGHTQRMVTVMPGVSLDVLDWGGRGPPLVLLTGFGNTAHVYDDLAPRLARDFHVFGITRRGYGRSSVAPPGLTVDRLADDVAVVLDSLHLVRPALVGHSLGTMELVVLGTKYAARLRGLVFLDGPYDSGYTDIAAAMAAYDSMPSPPPRAASDRVSYAAMQASDFRRDGYLTPIGEYEARYVLNPDGSLTRSASRGFDLDSIWATIHFPLELRRIPVPSLAIYSLWEAPLEHMVPYFARLNGADQATARALHARVAPNGRDEVRRRQLERFRREMPRGEAVGISGAPHYAFLGHADDVYQRMRKFLLGLPR